MMKINEKQLRQIIAKSINEAFRYDGDTINSKYNILISEQDYNDIYYDFPGLTLGGAARKGFEYIYADGLLEEDMRTDYFYVINPKLPDDNVLPNSFYGWYKGRKVIIGIWRDGGMVYGHAVYADDREAIERMKKMAKESK